MKLGTDLIFFATYTKQNEARGKGLHLPVRPCQVLELSSEMTTISTDDVSRSNWEHRVIFTLALLLLYITSTAVRFCVSLTLTDPLIGTDAVVYKTMADSYFRSGSFYALEHMGYGIASPNVLYPWVISHAFLFPGNLLIAIKAINAVLISLSIFPSYFLARQFASRRLAFVCSLLVASLAELNHNCFVMVEALYFPLFLFAIYFAYRSLIGHGLLYDLLSGLFCGLLLMTKFNAISSLIAIFVTAGVLSLLGSPAHRRQHLRSLLALVFSAGVSFSLLNLLLRHTLSFGLGAYEAALDDQQGSTVISLPFLEMILTYLVTLSFLYFLPLLSLAANLRQALHHRHREKLAFLILVLTLLLSHLAMVFLFNSALAHAEHYSRIHARYFSMNIPLLLIAFVLFYKDIPWHRRALPLVVLGGFIPIAIFAILFTLPQHANYGLLVVDNPGLAWHLMYGRPASLFIALLFLLSTVPLFTRFRSSLLPHLTFFFICFALANAGEIKALNHFDSLNAAQYAETKKLLSYYMTEPHPVVMMVDDHQPSLGMIFTAFWFPYDYRGQLVLPKGTALTEANIPPEVDHLILFSDYKIAIPRLEQRRTSNSTLVRIR